MSDRTGLDAAEVALLDALDLVGGGVEAEPARCSDVLLAVERVHGIPTSDSWPLLVARGVPWLVHLPLVELVGNAGFAGRPSARGPGARGRPALDPRGRWRSRRNGTRSARCRSDWSTGRCIAAARSRRSTRRPWWARCSPGRADAGIPVLPTGGTVDGELDALLRGEPARLTLGCTIIDEIDRVVITEVPLGVTTTAVVDAVDERLRGYQRWEGGVPRRIRRNESARRSTTSATRAPAGSGCAS